MTNSQKEFLHLFGWDDIFEKQAKSFSTESLVPGRVIIEERNLYRIQTDLEQSVWASISGKMMFEAKGRIEYPAVGDWVLVEIGSPNDRGVIHQIVPRKNIIHRKEIGSGADKQILSVNVDFIFITTSANEDLNYRRIERYLTIVRESGAQPIILVTKADLVLDSIHEIILELQDYFPGIAVYTLSKNNFESATFLTEYLKPGKTSIFIGSSGVGKSTIVNFLSGEEIIKTAEIRENDGKGRHTTTSRHLYVSRYGGLIIDTPGMRELQMGDHVEGLSKQFSEIDILISKCRFSDCKHETEPGCAIKEALDDGSLSEERWRSYQKLEAEIRHNLRKQDRFLASEERKLWKKRSIEARNFIKAKKGRAI